MRCSGQIGLGGAVDGRIFRAMKRILIVEDVEANRDLLVQLLEEEYMLTITVNGAEGLAAASRDPPDLILMDLSLPVLNGWEAIRRLKCDAALAPIPVIALTAHAMSGDEERARTAGCDDFRTKPIDEDELFAMLHRWLGGAV